MNQPVEENKCIRCGRCMAVCPVYQATFLEADAARGRLAVLEAVGGRLDPSSARVAEILSRCLLCGACAQACANDVPTARIIQQGRALLAKHVPGASRGSTLVGGLRRGGVPAEIILKGGALLEALFCRKIPENSGLHLRFPLHFFFKRRVIPRLAWTPFLKGLQPEPAGRRRSATRVALFVGCGGNYLFPEAPRALVRVFARLGIEVVIPQDQVCCGLPAYVAGDLDQARALARTNIEAFGLLEVDAVLTLCASCGAHLGNLASVFSDDSIFRQRARMVEARHLDAFAFLARNGSLVDRVVKRCEKDRQKGIVRVAYHDPCHLRIAQGQPDAPRTILEALPQVEMADSWGRGLCCGHGGDFNLAHFDLSMEILDRRMSGLFQDGPDWLVTGCTGCLLQFLEGVDRGGVEVKPRVDHPMVLLDALMCD